MTSDSTSSMLLGVDLQRLREDLHRLVEHAALEQHPADAVVLLQRLGGLIVLRVEVGELDVNVDRVRVELGDLAVDGQRVPGIVRTPQGAEELSPGDVVYFPEGPDGLHTFSNLTDEPVRMIGISTKRFPDVVAYPERGVAWVATRHPERPVPQSGDQGVIARFELPPDE